MDTWRTWLERARLPLFGGHAHHNGQARPHFQTMPDRAPQVDPSHTDRSNDEASGGTRIVDKASIERFRQQVSLHRRYGWEIYEYGETPPTAVLAPTPTPEAARLSRQFARSDLISSVRVVNGHRSWCRIWIDEGGEVRWRSITAPHMDLP